MTAPAPPPGAKPGPMTPNARLRDRADLDVIKHHADAIADSDPEDDPVSVHMHARCILAKLVELADGPAGVPSGTTPPKVGAPEATRGDSTSQEEPASNGPGHPVDRLAPTLDGSALVARWRKRTGTWGLIEDDMSLARDIDALVGARQPPGAHFGLPPDRAELQRGLHLLLRCTFDGERIVDLEREAFEWLTRWATPLVEGALANGLSGREAPVPMSKQDAEHAVAVFERVIRRHAEVMHGWGSFLKGEAEDRTNAVLPARAELVGLLAAASRHPEGEPNP